MPAFLSRLLLLVLTSLAAPVAVGVAVRSSAADVPPGTGWSKARAALEAMPLPTAPLTRSNAIRLILQSFVANDAVRAVVVLPGAVDDFHLVHRETPLPAITGRTLAGALEALTNATAWRLTFDPVRARLLIHTAAERVIPEVRVEGQGVEARLQQRRSRSKLRWIDARWSSVQPALEQALGRWVKPQPDADEAGHFERVNLAGQGLSELELLEAVSLASGTRLVVGRREVRFER